MLFQRRQLLRVLSVAFGSRFIFRLGQPGMAAQAAMQSTIAKPSLGAAVDNASAEGSEKEKVTGIGGLFFRAHDPKALGLWYKQHLGISLTPSSFDESPWQQEAGITIFSPFPENSDYFGDAHKVWMVNFRVRDLDRLAAQLRASGIAVKIDPQIYPNGRFARLHDPEENPIELWQPAVPVTPH
jgi:glyoxylase I family protein